MSPFAVDVRICMTQRIASDGYRVARSETDALATAVGYREQRVSEAIRRQKLAAFTSDYARMLYAERKDAIG